MNETGAALVTGAGRRIGRAIALDLGRRGWAVAVHHNRSADAAAEVAGEITAAGGRAEAIAADLADDAQAEALVPRCAAALGPLTLLVNSASVFENDRLASLTTASWDAHLEVNLRAPLVLIRGFAEQLPEGLPGNVVNLLDQCVWNPGPGFLSYTVSKVGLWTLTRVLALELAPRIRVNGIGPGPTLPSTGQTDADFEAHCARMPLGRGTTPEEICRAVRFILDAPALTGQMIALDGGEHLASKAAPGADAATDRVAARQTRGARQPTSRTAPPRPPSLADGERPARRMFIRDLVVDCRIGIHRHEQAAGQRVRINVDLTIGEDRPVDDSIANVVDYDGVIAGIKAIIDAGHINLVETLAERIGDFCVADPRVLSARVRVEKLEAVAEAASAGVEIERTAPVR